MTENVTLWTEERDTLATALQVIRSEDLLLGVSETGDKKQVIEKFLFEKGGDPNTKEFQDQMVKFGEFCAFLSAGGQSDASMGTSTGNRPWENLAEHQNLYKNSGVSLKKNGPRVTGSKRNRSQIGGQGKGNP